MVGNKGIHVAADDDIIVYVMNSYTRGISTGLYMAVSTSLIHIMFSQLYIHWFENKQS